MALLLGNEPDLSNLEKIHQTDVVKKISDCSIGSNDVYIIDPSEHFRPEHKTAEEYRIYTTNQVGHSKNDF